MRQFLLLVLLFVVGQWLVKALRRADARTGQRPDAAGHARHTSGAPGAGRASSNGAAGGARGAAARRLPEPMIRCAECGVHAPQSDSVSSGGDAFCSADHAQRYAARVAQAKGREGR
ncbi:MAG TPA: PP0621 family protein [Paraburkholderia sp.]|jgi:uncharacterized protein|nr:PP0621 family protein [Paraburkholderia sp.]